MQNCLNYDTITNSGALPGGANIGGIIGYASGAIIIENFVSDCKVIPHTKDTVEASLAS